MDRGTSTGDIQPTYAHTWHLTDAQIRRLEQALGKPMDGTLRQRLSRLIRDIVHLAIQPKPADHRGELRRLARQGRIWLREIAKNPLHAMLRDNSNFEQLDVEVTRFCDQVDAIRRQDGAAKAGPPRRRLLSQVFIGELIGIAKRKSVRPSTPGRAIRATKPPPRFYKFVTEALFVGREIVGSSSLTEQQKQIARLVFSFSDEALVKQIETARGRIGDYHSTAHGLVERPESKKKAKPRSRQAIP